MIIGIFWLVSTTLSWFLFVSLFLFLSPFLAVSCLLFVVCVSFIFYMLVHLGDFTSLVFSLALYLNCLLLDFIQYFCIIKKRRNNFLYQYCLPFVCMYTHTHTPSLSLSYTKIFVSLVPRNVISSSKGYALF